MLARKRRVGIMITSSPHRAVSQGSHPAANSGFRLYVLGLILLALAAAMIAVTGNDYAWTIWLHQHRIQWIDDFLGRTLFEGEGIGGSDFAIIFLAVVVVLYIHAWRKPDIRKLQAWRPYLGFIVSSGLVCSVYMVHSLKWVMGRARPRLVIKKGMAFTEWFEFGPHYVTEGIYRGSFPSGHTAAVLSLLTLAYALVACHSRNMTQRAAGVMWGSASIAYCFFMAIGRSMSLGHWLSDCLFSIFMGWTLMHVLYYWILKVPLQVQYYLDRHTHAATPTFWELKTCIYILLVVLGGMAVAIGMRAFEEQSFPWLAVLILPGGWLVWYFGRRLLRFLNRVFAAYRQ